MAAMVTQSATQGVVPGILFLFKTSIEYHEKSLSVVLECMAPYFEYVHFVTSLSEQRFCFSSSSISSSS